MLEESTAKTEQPSRLRVKRPHADAGRIMLRELMKINPQDRVIALYGVMCDLGYTESPATLVAEHSRLTKGGQA